MSNNYEIFIDPSVGNQRNMMKGNLFQVNKNDLGRGDVLLRLNSLKLYKQATKAVKDGKGFRFPACSYEVITSGGNIFNKIGRQIKKEGRRQVKVGMKKVKNSGIIDDIEDKVKGEMRNIMKKTGPAVDKLLMESIENISEMVDQALDAEMEGGRIRWKKLGKRIKSNIKSGLKTANKIDNVVKKVTKAVPVPVKRMMAKTAISLAGRVADTYAPGSGELVEAGIRRGAKQINGRGFRVSGAGFRVSGAGFSPN